MTNERTSLLNRLVEARTACAAVAAEANQFLADHSRTPVPVCPPDKLRLALLGDYNTGKSTLVNALLGSRVAETGDAPTTQRPHAYDYRGFQIIDLPGGNARPAEQEEARRAIREAHFVLYVVSSAGGLDSASLWSDLCDLEQRGALYLVVINDKQSHPDDESEQKFKRTVLENFYARARQHLQRSCWDGWLFWVKARSAERARVQGKPLLEQGSGIIPLETALVELLSEHDAFLRSVPSLSQLLAALRAADRDWTLGLNSDESRRLSEAVQRCENMRERLTARAELLAGETFFPLGETLSMQLCRSLDQPEIQAAVAQEATRLVQEAYRIATEAFDLHCQAELKQLSAWLGEVAVPEGAICCDEVRVDLGSIPHVAGTVAGPIPVLEKLLLTAPPLMQFTQQLAEGAGPMLGRTAGTALAEGALPAVPGTAKVVAPVGGPVVGRILGPAVIVLVACWELYAGWRKAEQEQRRMAAAVVETQSAAARAVTLCRQQFLGRVNHYVMDLLQPVLRQLQQELHARGREKHSVEVRLAQASDLRGRLESSIQVLNSRGRE